MTLQESVRRQIDRLFEASGIPADGRGRLADALMACNVTYDAMIAAAHAMAKTLQISYGPSPLRAAFRQLAESEIAADWMMEAPQA